MDRNEVSSTVMELINKTLMKKATIQLDHRLKEDLGVDSIGFVEIGTGLEEIYEIDISDEELEELQTVDQVVDVVLRSAACAVE